MEKTGLRGSRMNVPSGVSPATTCTSRSTRASIGFFCGSRTPRQPESAGPWKAAPNFVNAPRGHDGPPPPAIHAIDVDAGRGVIQIRASGHESVEWLSDGHPVHRGDRIDLPQVPRLARTLRAEVRAAAGRPVVGTQPFRLAPAPASEQPAEYPAKLLDAPGYPVRQGTLWYMVPAAAFPDGIRGGQKRSRA